jgi:hypothetical protein
VDVVEVAFFPFPFPVPVLKLVVEVAAVVMI